MFLQNNSNPNAHNLLSLLIGVSDWGKNVHWLITCTDWSRALTDHVHWLITWQRPTNRANNPSTFLLLNLQSSYALLSSKHQSLLPSRLPTKVQMFQSEETLLALWSIAVSGILLIWICKANALAVLKWILVGIREQNANMHFGKTFVNGFNPLSAKGVFD